MKYEAKIKSIKELNENKLRNSVIIPLLKAMGFQNVHEFHGSTERGKDIIFSETTKFGDNKIHAIVVSTKDITGAVQDNNSAYRILEQIEKSMNEKFTDKYFGRSVSPDRCMFITSGKIKNTAIDSIVGKLEKYNFNKLLRFIDCDRLIELVDFYYSSFWEQNEEIVYLPKFKKYKISLQKLIPPYDRDDYSLTSKNDIAEIVYDIKKHVHSILLNWEYDIHSNFEKILMTNDPWEIINAWEELSDFVSETKIYLGSDLGDIHSLWQLLVQDTIEIDEQNKNGV